MVIDNIKNAEKYFALHPEFPAVFAVLGELTPESENKRYEINGDTAFVNYSSYTNKQVCDCRFEGHEKYIDIQYVVSGLEKIDVCDAAGLAFTENRLSDGDIAFYETPGNYSSAVLGAGEFVVIFPGEAHRPLTAVNDKPVAVSKAVAKIIK